MANKQYSAYNTQREYTATPNTTADIATAAITVTAAAADAAAVSNSPK